MAFVKSSEPLNKTKKMIRGFGITDLFISFIFLLAVSTSEGGFPENTRIVAMAWFLLWCGIFNTFFCKKKWAAIVSIVFYSIGIVYNFLCGFLYPAHFFIMAFMIVFLVLISVNLFNVG